MNVQRIGDREAAMHEDPLRDELVELLEAAGALHGGEGPRAHVWEQIEASIARREARADAAIPIARNRARRARRSAVRIAAIAAAVASIGGIAYAALPSGVDVSAAPAPTPVTTPDVETIVQAARRALQQEGARVVTLTSSNGSSSVRLVVLPDGTAYVLGSELPSFDVGYWLYALVGDVQVLLGPVRDAGAVLLDRIPAGAALVVLVDEVGALVAGAPLATEPSESTPGEPARPGPAAREQGRRPAATPDEGVTSSPTPSSPAPVAPDAPPPDGPRPLIDVDVPSLLRDLLPG